MGGLNTDKNIDDFFGKAKERRGIILASPTGNVHPDNSQYIEVTLPDFDWERKMKVPYTVYARPCYAFGDIVAPSKRWLDKYKDEIFICLLYENGGKNNPLWVGYTPKDNRLTDIPKEFPNGYIKKTEKFLIRIDDNNGEMYIAHREFNDISQVIKITGFETTLGDINASKEPAALGDTTATLLGEIIDGIINAVYATPAGNTMGCLTAPTLLEIKQKLDTLKSKSIKLD